MKAPCPILAEEQVSRQSSYGLITRRLSRDEADRSRNRQAGFVADHGAGNPAARDFYLRSHGGLLGSSFITISNFSRPLIVIYRQLAESLSC